MRLSLLLLFLAAGCAQAPNPASDSVTGRAEDANKKLIIPVNPNWTLQVWKQSREAVFARLEVPKSGELRNSPSYDAYYDTERDISVLAVYGNITSRAEYGQERKQSYYVTWQQRGKANAQDKPWEMTDVTLSDVQF